MTSRSRTLKVDIVGDVRDLKRKLSQVENNTRSTSDSLRNAGRMIQGAFGAAAIQQVGQFVERMQQMNIEAEGIRNRFETVFGSGSNEMAEWADEVNERFGISVERVQDLANQIGDLLVPIGFTRNEAADLTQEVLQLSNALSEWSGGQIEVADAAERVRKALLGERESLEALGVKVLQSDVNARLAAEGNAELTGEAKAQAEALATLNIIQDKSVDAVKAYEEAQNQALIAEKNMTAAREDQQQMIADRLAPDIELLTEGVYDLTDAYIAAIEAANEYSTTNEGVDESQKTVIESLAELAAQHGGPVVEAIAKSIDTYAEYQRAVDDASNAESEFVSNPLPDHLTKTGDAAGNAAGDIDSMTTAIKEQQDAIRAATDPVFALRQANEKLNEAFADRVRLQAEGAGASEINAAIAEEIEARQDLEFAQQNANDGLEAGLDLIDRYAERTAIGEEAVRRFKEEILGLDSAIRGLPSDIRLPGVSGDSSGIRNLEEELNRRGRAVIE